MSYTEGINGVTKQKLGAPLLTRHLPRDTFMFFS